MQQIVMPFDGSTVEVIKNADGETFVSVRSVCRAIGINHSNQYEKLRSNPTFKVECYHSPSAGGPQETYCLPLNQLNLWLGSINPLRTKEPVRSNLITYQRECAEVLYNHFMPRGELDLQPLMDKITAVHDELKQIRGATDAVFGDDKNEIQSLVEQVAYEHGVDGRTVWGWVQSELDVQSYKKQNRKIINFLKNKLGKGLTLVKENT